MSLAIEKDGAGGVSRLGPRMIKHVTGIVVVFRVYVSIKETMLGSHRRKAVSARYAHNS